jgi:hypothetical protein
VKRLLLRLGEVTNIAAILVTIASLFASVCWITSGRAGGASGDLKTAALGFMILRLEAATAASSALVQAQSYLTQASMYYARADAADDEELKSYLNQLGDQSLEMPNFQASLAKEEEAKAQSYYDKYAEALESAARWARVADRRSTGALIFNVSAILASCAVLFKRRGLLYAFIPVFLLGCSYLVSSLL